MKVTSLCNVGYHQTCYLRECECNCHKYNAPTIKEHCAICGGTDKIDSWKGVIHTPRYTLNLCRTCTDELRTRQTAMEKS